MAFGDCPVCYKETNIKLNFDNINKKLTCNLCGTPLELDLDYSGEDMDLSMWLTRADGEAA